MGARSPEGAHGSSTTASSIQSLAGGRQGSVRGSVRDRMVLGLPTPATAAATQLRDLPAELVFDRRSGAREVVDLVGVVAQVVELALAGPVLHVRVPAGAHAVVVGDLGAPVEEHGVTDLAVTGLPVGPGLVGIGGFQRRPVGRHHTRRLGHARLVAVLEQVGGAPVRRPAAAQQGEQ